MILGILCFGAFWAVLLFLPRTEAMKTDSDQSRLALGYRQLLKNRVLRAMFVYRVATSFGRGVVAAFFPLLGENQVGLSTAAVGAILSANLLSTAFFQPLFGRLADRYGRRGWLVGGTVLQGVSLLAMPFVHDGFVLLGLNVIMGLAGAMSVPAASGIVYYRR